LLPDSEAVFRFQDIEQADKCLCDINRQNQLIERNRLNSETVGFSVSATLVRDKRSQHAQTRAF
jgi:hypothetical protein